ncbi:Amiloride-sensitive sodium channel subunit alpha [Ophiophagus hannah]|uniref:Epithelial sodium channel subunit alpha n=1 Tax=Ophiophagus hannah TaxID=8665 RepID=V8NGN1_OPHHA|nr:Amiloride-sensitive sodium channel subunit alpha [Ophiophagus hannah]
MKVENQSEGKKMEQPRLEAKQQNVKVETEMEEEKKEESEGLIEFFSSYQDLFQFFCNNTTIHGAIRLVCSKKNKMKTAFWTVLFFLTFGLLYWQFGIIYKDYFSFPVNLNLNLNSDRLTFPAVTLCTLNPYRYSAFRKEMEELDQMTQQTLLEMYKYNMSLDHISSQKHISRSLYNHIRRYPLHRRKRDIRALEDKKREVGKRDSSIGFTLCNENRTDCYQQMYSSGVDAIREWYSFHYINILAKFPDTKALEESNFTSFIYACRFNEMTCNKANYTHFHHPIYGNCYTFNDNSSSLWMSSLPGINNGLSLVVRTEQNDFIPLLSSVTGARIMVHNQNEPAFMDEGGFNVRPGIETSISMRKETTQRLGGSYSDCTENGSDVPVKNLFSSRYTEQYECTAEYSKASFCASRSAYVPVSRPVWYNNVAVAIISTPYPMEQTIVTPLSMQPGATAIISSKLNLKQTTWAASLNAGNLATDIANLSFQSSVFHMLKEENKYNVISNRNGIAKVNIFFNEWNYKSNGESPAFTVVTLLSQLGNQWSLWFGSSVLSVVELAELILDFLIVTCILVFRRLYSYQSSDLYTPSNSNNSVFHNVISAHKTPQEIPAETGIAALPSYNTLETLDLHRVSFRRTE